MQPDRPVLIKTVARTVQTDLLTPVSLFLRLSAHRKPFFLLESAGDAKDLGRYSYIGMDPQDLTELIGSIPLESPEDFLKNRLIRDSDDPALMAGIVGHVSYHAIETVFPITLHNRSEEPTHQFFLAGLMAVLDHQLGSLRLIRNLPDPSAEQLEAAEADLLRLELALQEPSPAESSPSPLAESPLRFQSSFTREGFLEAVEKAQEYIRAGDIFQVVLSQQFTAEGDIDGFTLYRHLRRYNPAPYLSYIRFPEFEALCSSPEMLVRLSPGRIETVPIAGTRPLLNDGLDGQRELELAEDPKELAEHLMLVDLGRNDLSKAAMPGTVEVTDFCKVHHLSRVMHLVSHVSAVPRPDIGPLNGLMCAFPAGTVSGAPKLRAMEIIDELEPVPRNLYAGAIVILDPAGHLNSCIAIRTITLKNGRITLQAGAGIVLDSVPENEYQETLNKARALFSAVEASTKGAVTYAFNDRQL